MINCLTFLEHLKAGNFGLARTYWKLGVMVKFIFIMMLFLSMSIHPILGLLVMTLYMGYMPFALMGIWNAAKKYNGAKIWTWIAKFIVVISIAVYVNEAYQAGEFVQDSIHMLVQEYK